MGRRCSIEGCDRPHTARGWCSTHWKRWDRHGDPEHVAQVQVTGTIRERILARIVVDEAGCWLWQGSITATGYGSMYVGPGAGSVHRAAYEAWVGPIPDGLEIDHLCRVRSCCNPDHLEAVTHRTNMARSDAPRTAARARWAKQ